MDNWLNWIGLAKRAGQLAPGHNQVQKAMNEGTAKLILIALDAGESVYRKYHLWAQNLGVPLVQAGSMIDIGRSMGMGPHAVLAILDKNIANRLATQLGVSSGGIKFDRKRKSSSVRVSQRSEVRQSTSDRSSPSSSRREHQEPHEHGRTGSRANGQKHHGGKVATRTTNHSNRGKKD